MSIRSSICMRMVLLGLFSAAAAQVSAQERGVAKPSQLEQRVMARALKELPDVAQLYPQNPNQPITVQSEHSAIGFFYAQPQARDTKRYEKIKYDTLSTRIGEERIGAVTRVRSQRSRKERKEGTVDFYIQATTLSVTMDAAPVFRLWGNDSIGEMAAKYNQEQEENRRKAEQGRQRGMGTSQRFPSSRPPLRQEGEPMVTWDDYMTTVESHLYAEALQRDYLGVPGEVIAYRDKGVWSGYPAEYYGEFIYHIARGDLPKEIEARARYKLGDDEVLLRVHTKAWHLGWADRVVSVEQVDAIMRRLVRILLEELGQPVPAETPVPSVTGDRSETETESAWPSSVMTPGAIESLQRLGRMRDRLAGLEDEIQAMLTLVKLVSDETAGIRKEIHAHRALLAKAREDGDAREQERLSAVIAELRGWLREREEYREELAGKLTQLLDGAITDLEKLHNEWGFGELEEHAFGIVHAARERRDLMLGQLYFSMGDKEKLRAHALGLQAQELGKSKGYFFEGMTHMMDGNVLLALEAFRRARVRGMSGEALDALERNCDVHILRALQARVSGARAGFWREYELWNAAKAETADNPNRSRFGWMFERLFWRGYYDTMSGLVGRGTELLQGDSEAQARREETATVADDLARSHIGLELIIALREDGYALRQIQEMRAEEFREVAQKRLGNNLTEEEVRDMRRVMSHALALPDLQYLMNGGDLAAENAMTSELVRQIHVDAALPIATPFGTWDLRFSGSTWETLGNVGNLMNGWMMGIMFAPMARLSTQAPSLMSSTEAASQFEGVLNVGQYFTASAPVQALTRLVSSNATGKKMLEGMAAVHHWSEQSVGRTVATMVGTTTLEIGLAHAVAETFGKDAAYLVDVMGMLGATSPSFYAQALERAGAGGRQVRTMATRLREGAARSQTAARRLSELADETRTLLRQAEGAIDPSALDGLALRAGRLAQADGEMAATVMRALDDARAGKTLSAIEHLNSADRVSTRVTRQAEQALGAADHLDQVATAMPDQARTALELENAGLRETARPGGQSSRTARRVVPETPRDGLADWERQSFPPESPRLQTMNEARPTFRADRLMSEKEFTKAAAEYRRVLSSLDDADTPLGRTLRGKVQAAEQAAEEALRCAAPSGRATEPVTDELADLIREAAKNGYATPRLPDGSTLPHLEEVGVTERLRRYAEGITEGGTRPVQPHLVRLRDIIGIDTASSPAFVIGRDGRVLATLKPVRGAMSGQAEGIAESIAAEIRRSAGREGPASRVLSDVQLRGGGTEGSVATRAFPDGAELADLNPTRGALLARRDDIAEDMVYSLLLGDADRHLGNFRVTSDGRMFGFDNGLADLFPEHVYRSRAHFDLATQEAQGLRTRVQQLEAQLDQLGEAGRQELAGTRSRLQHYERWQRVAGDYTPSSPELKWGSPAPGSAQQFDAFVDETLGGHLRYMAEQWGDESGLLYSSIRFEDVARHLDDIEQKVVPQLERILRDTMGADHAHFAYTLQLLQTRAKKLRGFLQNRFPSIPSVSRVFRIDEWLATSRPAAFERLVDVEHLPMRVAA